MNTQSRAKQFLRFDGRMAQEWFRQLLQLPRHFKGSRLVRQKLEKIFPLFPGHKDPLTRIHLQHQVADCLLEIIDCSKKQLPQRNSERLPLIDDFIRTHLDEPVTLPALAKLTRLSLSHFKSWFKQETGNTPLDYVLRYKIREAQRLLGNEKLSMADIAFDTGFQNPQYFASVFKKFTGLTPTAYRLRLRNGKRT